METKVYRMRPVGNGAVQVFIPIEVIERESKQRGMGVDEFVRRFRAVAVYDGSPGVVYQFAEEALV